MTTTNAKLDAIIAMMQQQDARIAAIESGKTVSLAASAPETVKTTAAPAKTASDGDTVTGTVLRLAASGKGVVLADAPDVWHNALTPIFADLTVGESVVLTREHKTWTGQRSKTDKTQVRKSGLRVVSWERADGEAKQPATATVKTTATRVITPAGAAIQREERAMRAATIEAEEARESVPCLLCTDLDGKSVKHGNNANGMTAYQCLSRQFKATGERFNVKSASDWRAFVEWICDSANDPDNENLNFATDRMGTVATMLAELTDDSDNEPEPTPPATPEPTPRKRSTRAAASKNVPASIRGGRRATNAADMAVLAAGEALVTGAQAPAAPSAPVVSVMADGEHDVLVSKTLNTSGIIRLVNGEYPGAKGDGLNIRPAGEKTTAKMLPAAVGDRAIVKIKDGKAINFRITSTSASVTGITPGIATSETKTSASTTPPVPGSVTKAERKGTAAKRGKSAPAAQRDPNLCADCGRRFTMVGKSTINPDLCRECGPKQPVKPARKAK